MKLEIKSIHDVYRIGDLFHTSGMFSDTKSAAQAVVKIMAGMEMGFGPFAAMQGVNIIQGKPSPGANLMAAAVRNHPRYDYNVERLEDDGCTLVFYKDGEIMGKSAFTAADAKRAKKSGGNWEQYPRNMMFSRAMSNGVRWYCPDVFGGATVYTPEELGEDGPDLGQLVTPNQEYIPDKPELLDEEGAVVEPGTWKKNPDYKPPIDDELVDQQTNEALDAVLKRRSKKELLEEILRRLVELGWDERDKTGMAGLVGFLATGQTDIENGSQITEEMAEFALDNLQGATDIDVLSRDFEAAKNALEG